MLMTGLLKSGQLILYYDSTGGLLKMSRDICGTKKHLLHSLLSFCPAEMFLKNGEFEFKAKLFLAFVLAEHISHKQTALVHNNFARHIMTACRSLDPECGNPLLVNTDGDGALQNGWLSACAGPGQVTNRIQWANIVTLVMFWYENKLLHYVEGNG